MTARSNVVAFPHCDSLVAPGADIETVDISALRAQSDTVLESILQALEEAAAHLAGCEAASGELSLPLRDKIRTLRTDIARLQTLLQRTHSPSVATE